MWWLFFCVLLYIWLIFPGRTQVFPKQKYYGHRGLFDHKHVQENSLEAFTLAIDQGYGVELDVQLSRDGQVVVFHDANLKRLFQRNEKIRDLTAEELKPFQIPTLVEVLQLFKGQQPLIIELKNHGQTQELCEAVANLLDGYTGEFMVESFDPRIVYWFRRHRPHFIRGQLLMSIRQYEQPLLGLFLVSMVYHVFTRPHFLATHTSMSMRFYGRVLPLLKMKRVLWTVYWDEVEPIQSMDAMIFEFNVESNRKKA